MMFFQDGQYPRCGKIIRSRVLTLNHSSRIYLAFVECCEDARIAASAFRSGTYPRIVITPNSVHGTTALPGYYNGHCKKGDMNYIFISTKTANSLENDEEWEYYLKKSSNFERVVLHEAVHWARFMGGKPGEIDLSGKKKLQPGERKTAEAGSWFDYRAYGIPYKYHDGIPCKYGERPLKRRM